MRNELIEFMDSIRDYVRESGTNIAHDERDSSEFVDIYLKEKQSENVVLDGVSNCDCNEWHPIKNENGNISCPNCDKEAF